MSSSIEIGQKFGRWTVLSGPVKPIGDNTRGYYYLCRCSCAEHTERLVFAGTLRNGTSRSCGCLKVEWGRLGQARLKHGHDRVNKRTTEYRSWSQALNRVTNKNSEVYKNWGGRGIKICERWADPEYGFENFLADMGPKPSPIHSLDRINNDGDYSPENCRWATPKQQNRNKRNNKLYYIFGGLYLAQELSEMTGIPRRTIHKRINDYGWSVEKAVSKKTQNAFK
jgi:hypothetical protein